MRKVVSNVNRMKVSGRASNRKPAPAGAIKIYRPKKQILVKKGEKGLDNYVIGSIELE